MAASAPHPNSFVKNGGQGAVDEHGNPVFVLTIPLGPWISLTIAEDHLNILDRNPRKRSRSSCSFPLTSKGVQATRSIPLYNILWAELIADSTFLVIDFAESKGKDGVKAAKVSFPIVFPDQGTGQPNLPLINAFVTTLINRSYGQAQVRKRAYVLINPHAGPGRAERQFDQEVMPIFAAARMTSTIWLTGAPKQAVDMCQNLDINNYDVIVACSGDGLPHECFNGLAKRPDARNALRSMPVAMIPCGSGNAMACNLYGSNKPSVAALGIVKGVRTPLDLVSITQGAQRTVSFLSQAFGLVADLDLGTEGMRWMGEHRFLVGFLQKVFVKKQYPCDIAVRVEIDNKADIRRHYTRLNGGGAPAGEDAAGEDAGGENAGGENGGGENGGGENAAGEEAPAGEEVEEDVGPGLPALRYGTVGDKIPEGWERLALDHLGNFYCGNMGYMAPDANFFPAAIANDGLIDMVTVNGDISPLEAITMQLGVESGNFFDNPLVTYRKVSAYRVTPRQTTGLISIDGEKVPFQPFQAEVHQSLGLTLSRSGKYEAPGPRGQNSGGATERLLG